MITSKDEMGTFNVEGCKMLLVSNLCLGHACKLIMTDLKKVRGVRYPRSEGNMSVKI